MSNGASEIYLSEIKNSQPDKEHLDEQTVKAFIPPRLMEIIRSSGTNPHEVKGIYLSPKHSLNPYPGKHFIGENPESSIEFDTKLMLKLEAIMTSEDLDMDLRAVADSFAKRFENLLRDGLPSDWIRISKASILKHEETHRDQNVNFEYLDIFEDVAKTMREIRDRIGNKPNAQLENFFDSLNSSYKTAFVQTEVQALVRGLDYFADHSDDKGIQEGFALYWIGKVCSLFSKYEGNKRSETVFDEVFSRIREKKMMFEDLDNVINQLARVIMLTGNRNLILEIESGTVSNGDLKRQVIAGLEKFVEDPAGYIAKVSLSGLDDDRKISDDLTKLKKELQKAQESVGVQK